MNTPSTSRHYASCITNTLNRSCFYKNNDNMQSKCLRVRSILALMIDMVFGMLTKYQDSFFAYILSSHDIIQPLADLK